MIKNDPESVTLDANELEGWTVAHFWLALNKAAERSMTPAALPCWVRMGTISGGITLSLSRDAATELAR
jgi:hypothetical protein